MILMLMGRQAFPAASNRNAADREISVGDL
jgi:hypothetical protein